MTKKERKKRVCWGTPPGPPAHGLRPRYPRFWSNNDHPLTGSLLLQVLVVFFLFDLLGVHPEDVDLVAASEGFAEEMN